MSVSSITPPELPFACDLVMKGGITSGVVYPAAIAELATDHRFHNIGGSSAGAIAAVVTAAAEYGRSAGGTAFDGLNALPEELAAATASGQTTLQSLFVPQPGTREYFDLFWKLRSPSGAGALARVKAVLPSLRKHSSAMPQSKLVASVAFGLPVAGIAWAIAAPAASTIGVAVLASVIGAAIYVGARVVAGARGMIADAQAQVAGNMHGLCNGRSVGDTPGLTDWLHQHIEEIAGPLRSTPTSPDNTTPPLTYGDLRRADVGLVTLTTNLSQNASEHFPFTDHTWAFAPADIRALFPAAVADHLIARGELATADPQTSTAAKLTVKNLLKLPVADELPVLLGARISLSFPLVLSALPLWRLTPVMRDDKWDTDYREVWLSDGGICSNLPVHLFDRALPSRPTYGINLSSGAVEPQPGEPQDDAHEMELAHRNVWRPIRTGAGSLAPITTIGTTAQFLGEVLNTMQNWSDNSMTLALGVRDRVCTIRLGETEGGMNLDMSGDTIRRLIPRGRAAGENLAWMVRGIRPQHMAPAKDDGESGAQWTRHRWTRLRAAALALGDHLDAVGIGRTKAAVAQHGSLANSRTFDQLSSEAQTLAYLPYRSDWTSAAGNDLTAAMDAIDAIDFGSANTASPPPLRRLVLSGRQDPSTELDG